MKKALIGGTGVYRVSEKTRQQTVGTPYGSVDVEILTVGGEDIVFLARHGKDHSVPPHRINYRGNMKALEILGVKYVFATAAVGSCSENYYPGDLVVIRDYLDFTKTRAGTFFEGGDSPVCHVDQTEPYCGSLRRLFYRKASEIGVPIKGDAVYVCTEGPRFESAAEIRMFKKLEGEVVGMTNFPEVVLAKELGMCYAAIGLVTNWCTGMKQEAIGMHDIQQALGNNKERVAQVFLNVFSDKLDQDHCTCARSVVQLT